MWLRIVMFKAAVLGMIISRLEIEEVEYLTIKQNGCGTSPSNVRFRPQKFDSNYCKM